jgi:hypothetical protein
MITARPGSNATSIPILTEVLELPQQLATPLPVVPQELVPQHLSPEPLEPPPPEPLVMRTRGASSPDFSARLVDAAGMSEHAVPETQAGEAAHAPESIAVAVSNPTLLAPVPLSAVPSLFQGQGATSAPAPAPALAAGPALDLDALAERVRVNVLADLQDRIEPVLRERMVQRLEPVLRTAMADISQALQEEIAGMVDQAVQKALIRHVTGQI